MIDFPDSPTNGQLFFDETSDTTWEYVTDQWVPAHGVYKSLGQFKDVQVSNPQSNDGLKWDGSKFVNSQLPAAIPADFNKTHVTVKYPFRVHQGEYSTYGDNVLTKMPLDTVQWNWGVAFDTVNHEYVVPVSGHWLIGGSIGYLQYSRNRCILDLYKNGVQHSLMAINKVSSYNGVVVLRGIKMIELNQGDKLDLRFRIKYYSTYKSELFQSSHNSMWGYLYRAA